MRLLCKRFLFYILLLSCVNVLAEVPIKFMLNNKKTFGAEFSLERALHLIKYRVLPQINQSKYLRIQVQPVYVKHEVNHLNVYLLSNKTFSFKIMRVNVGSQMKFLSLIKSEPPEPEPKPEKEPPEAEEKPGVCPDETIDFVVAGPLYSELPSTKKAFDNIVEKAEVRGYHVLKLYDGAATLENYKNYLSCKNLRGFISVAHGSPGAILLDDDLLEARYFDQFKDQLANVLSNAVIDFNSCEVFNIPYSVVMINYAGAKHFVGGNTSLVIGDSEKVVNCFWLKAFAGEGLANALESCENEFDSMDHDIGYGRDIFIIGGYGSDKLSAPAFVDIESKQSGHQESDNKH